MPRFFFHLHGRDDSLDREGTELPDVDVARTEAVNLAGGLLREQGHDDVPLSPLCVVVVDEGGSTVFRVEVAFVHPAASTMDVRLWPGSLLQ